MKSIKISGIYRGSNSNGLIVGGTVFARNNEYTALIDKGTYDILSRGVKDGWFEITNHIGVASMDQHCMMDWEFGDKII